MKCTECPEYRECVKHSNLAIKRKICPKAKVEKQLTNADRIRAMSDDELADFITNCGCYDHSRDCRASCKDCTMEWLKQPAED